MHVLQVVGARMYLARRFALGYDGLDFASVRIWDLYGSEQVGTSRSR